LITGDPGHGIYLFKAITYGPGSYSVPFWPGCVTSKPSVKHTVKL
jgi:hypothetical protein